MKKEKLLFKHMRSPGDLLMLTVAIRDLHKTYPDRFITAVESCYPEVFYNNPYVSPRSALDDNYITINAEYTRAFENKTNTGKHFSDGFIDDLNEQLNLNIKKTSMFPEIYLKKEEKEKCEELLQKEGIKGKFWLFNAGVKQDMPLKGYPVSLWKDVIKNIQEEHNIQLIQVGHSHNIHPEFRNVKSLVGKTNCLRDYFALVEKATGSIGAISLQMHVSAAFKKPCVVIAGGREEPTWEQYIGQTYLHTVGLLECCKYSGCWKSKIQDCVNFLRVYYLDGPECMGMISPEQISSVVLKYNNIF